MRQSAVSFNAKGMKFEGIMALPDGEGPFPGVVMCHPHPLHGGSMDNNVVVAVTFGLADAGIASLRFNFRGVGNSEGVHTEGEKEYEEALMAMDFLGALPDVMDDRIGLGGYSFSTRVICIHKQLYKKPRAIALVAPSLEAITDSPLQTDKTPRMIITGGRDRLVNSEGVDEQLARFDPPTDYHVIPGADHFWVGQEGQMAACVVQFFRDHLL
jgi:alpha/beta superfamily hydrolase